MKKSWIEFCWSLVIVLLVITAAGGCGSSDGSATTTVSTSTTIHVTTTTVRSTTTTTHSTTTTRATTTTTTTIPFPGYYRIYGVLDQGSCPSPTVALYLGTAEWSGATWDTSVYFAAITFTAGQATFEATTTEAGTYYLLANNNAGYLGVPGGWANRQPTIFAAHNPSIWAINAGVITMEYMGGGGGGGGGGNSSISGTVTWDAGVAANGLFIVVADTVESFDSNNTSYTLETVTSSDTNATYTISGLTEGNWYVLAALEVGKSEPDNPSTNDPIGAYSDGKLPSEFTPPGTGSPTAIYVTSNESVTGKDFPLLDLMP